MDSEQKPAQLYEHVAPEQNPAVALCYESYDRALKEAEGQHMFRNQAINLARKVYQKAMPPLVGRENIQNFIACVAHAMLLGIIEPGRRHPASLRSSGGPGGISRASQTEIHMRGTPPPG